MAHLIGTFIFRVFSLTSVKPLSVKSPPGGILADEMGLGKTVEVLACMLCNRRENLPSVDPLPVIPEEENKVTFLILFLFGNYSNTL